MDNAANWLGSSLAEQDPIAPPLQRDGNILSGMSEADHTMNTAIDQQLPEPIAADGTAQQP